MQLRLFHRLRQKCREFVGCLQVLPGIERRCQVELRGGEPRIGGDQIRKPPRLDVSSREVEDQEVEWVAGADPFQQKRDDAVRLRRSAASNAPRMSESRNEFAAG